MQLRDDNTDTPSEDDDKETKTIIKNFTRIYHGNLQGVVDFINYNSANEVGVSYISARQSPLSG